MRNPQSEIQNPKSQSLRIRLHRWFFRHWPLAWRADLEDEISQNAWLAAELGSWRRRYHTDLAAARTAAEKAQAEAETRGAMLARIMHQCLDFRSDPAPEIWHLAVMLPKALMDRGRYDERDWRLLVAERVSAAVLADLTKNDPKGEVQR